ncbi:Gldg family protein [Marinifilum sp.]|uniref:Gldg family protein n=1 Tax=Marinifilum sp. TaxID=2033137 RepID=UPI003BA8E2E9
MKITLKIAKLQLLNLMYSPISWVVLMVFALYSGIQFTGGLESIHGFFKQRPDGMSLITNRLFTRDYYGYFFKMKELMFLFVPILTMGFISNEMNSGTIKLLYSSPLKIRNIVVGKYVAMLVFSLAIILVMAMAIIGAGFFIPGMDTGVTIAGLIGFFLLIATYSAVGLFMSSLSRYQIISGIATIAFLYVLDFLGGLAQDVPVLRDILYWLSISNHSTPALQGYMVSTNIFYFIIVSVLFLAFTVNKLHADRQNKKGKQKIRLQSAAYLCIAIVCIGIAAIPKLKVYGDMTETKMHTAHPGTQEILDQLKEDQLKVKFFGHVNSSDIRPSRRRLNERKFYSIYTRFLRDTEFEYQMFYAPVEWDSFKGEAKNYSPRKKAEMLAYYEGLDMNEIKDLNELDATDQEAIGMYEMDFGVLEKIIYKDQHVFLKRERDDVALDALEIDYATQFKTLIHSPYQVSFITGHKERSIKRAWEQDWNRMAKVWKHRSALINHGFIVNSRDITKGDIKEDTDILMILDPMIAYSEAELSKIKSYIDKGGNLLIAAEGKNSAFINPLLSLINVELQNSSILSDHTGRLGELCMGTVNKNAPGLLTDYGMHEIELPGASPLTYKEKDGFKVTPLLNTNGQQTSLAGQDQKESFTVALALERNKNGKQQKIVVVGDADFAADKVIMKNRRDPFTANTLFYKNIFRWFTAGEYPLLFEPNEGSDNKIIMSNAKEKVYKVIYIWIFPFAILFIGGFIFWRRRRM